MMSSLNTDSTKLFVYTSSLENKIFQHLVEIRYSSFKWGGGDKKRVIFSWKNCTQEARNHNIKYSCNVPKTKSPPPPPSVLICVALSSKHHAHAIQICKTKYHTRFLISVITLIQKLSHVNFPLAKFTRAKRKFAVKSRNTRSFRLNFSPMNESRMLQGFYFRVAQTNLTSGKLAFGTVDAYFTPSSLRIRCCVFSRVFLR